MANVAVILCGCGFQDGSEVQETVLCLLALSQAGHQFSCFAPDRLQRQVVDHVTGKEMFDARNCLVESARIVRGEIKPLKNLEVEAYDALLMPGGFGVAKTLSDWAREEEECSVDETLQEVILKFHSLSKPIGATCITPAILGRVFKGVKKLTLTLGSDPATNEKLNLMGMDGVLATVSEMVADEENKIYTTPCYMEPPNLAGMYEGIQKVVARIG